MKRILTQIACAGALVLGFTLIGTPANANASGLAGRSAANTFERISAEQPLVQVDHRRHRKWRRHHGHRKWHRPPPRAGFYFEFGRPAPYFYQPHYARPRPVRPYYRRPVRLSRAHVRWCHHRYRSYRAYDNTFQPYHGPRKACRSPNYR
ncbi:BA14K family protein [Nitratireductor sp. GISD-1A_MAKvit]|uniref:BA14K family protein n=1 Tax=Nitratireductor sp. GISD-1A_MAKvit TaxID=3234198 RepID=UPI003467398A